MAQRLTSAELPRRTASRQTRKRLRKTTVLRSLYFCCKKRGITTAGCVRLQPVDALQPWVVFRLQLMDALQLLVVFRLQLKDALQLPVVFPLQSWDALQPWVVFGTFDKKEGMVKPSLLIFNQRFRAGECGYVCGFDPRHPAPGRAPQGG